MEFIWWIRFELWVSPLERQSTKNKCWAWTCPQINQCYPADTTGKNESQVTWLLFVNTCFRAFGKVLQHRKQGEHIPTSAFWLLWITYSGSWVPCFLPLPTVDLVIYDSRAKCYPGLNIEYSSTRLKELGRHRIWRFLCHPYSKGEWIQNKVFALSLDHLLILVHVWTFLVHSSEYNNMPFLSAGKYSIGGLCVNKYSNTLSILKISDLLWEHLSFCICWLYILA